MTDKEEIKIIEEISKEIIKRGRLLYSYEIKEILDRFITDIKCLNEDAWTPITEGQPKLTNKPYLVTLDYNELGLCVGHRIYFGNDKWDDPCVIAWQPLPEPYKKENIKTDCLDEDAKQASIPYTYNAPQHESITRPCLDGYTYPLEGEEE